MSKTPDSMLADPQELIADLQRQLAECRAERDEALARETATTEVLQVINSSPGDLAPVFEAMLDRALRLCDSVFGALWRYNGEYFELVAQRGVAKAVIGARSGHQRPTSPGTAIGQILAGENVVKLTNLGEDQLYKSGDPDRHNLVDGGGARTALAVALRKDDKLLGHIVTWHLDNKP